MGVYDHNLPNQPYPTRPTESAYRQVRYPSCSYQIQWVHSLLGTSYSCKGKEDKSYRPHRHPQQRASLKFDSFLGVWDDEIQKLNLKMLGCLI